ncbi:MAG: sulfotransferase [Xanthomonadales bacterium]|nr:sulfotransferase [Xanthomonadales bacterium]
MSDASRANPGASPDDPEVRRLLAAAGSALQSGRLAEAERLSRRLLALAPALAQAHFIASHVELRSGRPGRAAERAVEACRLSPGHPPWQLHEAFCLDLAGNKSLAAERAQALAGQRPIEPALASHLVQLLYSLGRFEAARDLCIDAIEREPASTHWQVNRASLEVALGNLDEAREALRAVLDREPDHAEAWMMWSSLGGDDGGEDGGNDNRAASIERLGPLAERESLSAVDRAKLNYALGALLEKEGRYADSYNAVSRGARAWRSQLRYDPAEEIEFFEAIEKTFDAAFVRSAGPGYDDDRPIFVVGLPRTGTTLVERILSSHSQVGTAGELPDFSRHLGRRIETLADASVPSRAAMAPLARQIDYAALGRDYIESSRHAAGERPHFVDKFPQNAIHIGPLRLALPRARIVLVRRHPMDACYSMYKQLFTDIYQFSYDLDELAAYFIAHERLMRHWLRLFPDSLLTVRYEDVVDNLECEARRMLEFCSLPWEEGCLAFHRNRNPSTTASAGQVRQPIYRGSLGKWRHFREQLAGLEARLADAGCLDEWAPPPED